MGQGIEVVVMAQKKDRREESLPVADDRRSARERRQFERVLVDLEVDYRCEDTFLFAYITDISVMGIFIQTNSPESPGTRLNLRFMTPSGDSLELEGEVIWINPYRPGDQENINPGMGIRFIDLTPDQRDELTHLVKTFAYLHDENIPEAEAPDGEDVVGDPLEAESAETEDELAAVDLSRLSGRGQA